MRSIKGFPSNALVLVLVCFFWVPSLSQQPTTFTSITSGGIWLADDGKHIDCHAGNIIYSTPSKRYYWFGEHRASPGGVACYSSADLFNWKNEGLAMQKGAIAVLERPKVAYNATTKKYVLWFHYDNGGYGLAHLGVASSDSIRGPYTLVDHFLPNGHQSRDMGMYCDDNGKVYIIYAADPTNVTIRIVELTSDYLNVTTNDVDIQAHCEGPGMLKLNGVYYLITSKCSGWTPNQATYYTATSATGPFTSKGDPCVGDTNHTTFNSQPCNIFQIPGYTNGFMYMGDRWNGVGSANSQYVFLPITIMSIGAMQIKWAASWTPSSVFTPSSVNPQSAYDFKMTAFTNAMSHTGLHAFDLLGRMQISSFYTAGPERKIVRLKNSDIENDATCSGEYIAR